ncbi:MAG: rhodanese-like domain-containing protein [Planctomycetes bacterium]|nr:rhodanese-like domain-containing protein [Planctomycetota bacterium]
MPYIRRRAMSVFLPTCILLSLIAACEKGAAPTDAPRGEVSTETAVKADITPQEAKAFLDANDGYVYLDVRTVAEFSAGHVPRSINIPYISVGASGERGPNGDFLKIVQATLAKDAKVIVACQSGGRSKRAQRELLRAGYTGMSNLLGGFGGKSLQPGWSSLDYPVEAGDGGENSYAVLRAKAAP